MTALRRPNIISLSMRANGTPFDRFMYRRRKLRPPCRRCSAAAELGACWMSALAQGVCCSFLVLRRSEEHTSELQSLMRISYAVFCLKKNKPNDHHSFIVHPLLLLTFI